MPKIIIDYSNTIIYKIVCKDLTITDLYIGSTTNFIKRKAMHKRNALNLTHKDSSFKVYEMIRNNGGWDNWDMVEIEKYPCIDGNEARARERYRYEELMPTMNTIRPKISKAEFREYQNTWRRENYNEKNKENNKRYHEAHRSERLEQMKEYREKNKDKNNSEEAKEKRKLYMREYRKKQRELNV
jgi:hypothetical protein